MDVESDECIGGPAKRPEAKGDLESTEGELEGLTQVAIISKEGGAEATEPLKI